MANKNNGNGTAARKRGKWTGGHPMRKCHVYKMLANPLYAARIRADSEVVAANHARAVDDRTFDLVQEKLKENTRNPGTQHRPKLECLLRGLLYCTCCGSAMSPSYSSSKQRRYRYYVCIRATQRNGDGCTTRAVSAPVVEEAVIESVRHFVLAPEVVERRVSSTLRHPAWEFTDFLPLLLGRVRLVSGVEHHLAVGQDGLGVAEMNHGRGQQADAGVAVLLVVPLEKLLAEGAAVLDAATLPRSAWMLSWSAGERS